MQIKSVLCFLCIFLSATVFGLEVKPCYIKDRAQHEANQKILAALLEKECAFQETPQEQAHDLSSRITQIANALLKNGFSTDAYAVPEIDPHAIVAFDSFVLWEGEKNGTPPLPLTFFVYVWPSEELALKYHPPGPHNCFYASTIHSHPLPCAFAVLEGTLTQQTYTSCEGRLHLTSKELFEVGEGEVDDLQKPFIHRLSNKGSGPCIVLHAYGLPSAEKVMHCFQDTASSHTYE